MILRARNINVYIMKKLSTKKCLESSYFFDTFRTFLKVVDPIFLQDYNNYDLGQSRADVMKFYLMYYFGGEF